MVNSLPEPARRVRAAARALGLDIAVRTMPGSTHTAADAAAALGCDLGQVVKSLVFRGRDTGRPISCSSRARIASIRRARRPSPASRWNEPTRPTSARRLVFRSAESRRSATARYCRSGSTGICSFGISSGPPQVPRTQCSKCSLTDCARPQRRLSCRSPRGPSLDTGRHTRPHDRRTPSAVRW